MSKIEVNEIDKQSGSTLTLGGSGTAVTLACGATQSGFGRTGTVDWQTSIKTAASFTASNGEGYFVDTSSNAVTANLPAGSFNISPSLNRVRGTAFKAQGGPVKGGGSYIVGERGPEMFSPGVSGMITPNHALGGSTNIVVNVDASGSSVEGDEQQGRELGLLISSAVQSEIIQQQRPGGLLA